MATIGATEYRSATEAPSIYCVGAWYVFFSFHSSIFFSMKAITLGSGTINRWRSSRSSITKRWHGRLVQMQQVLLRSWVAISRARPCSQSAWWRFAFCHQDCSLGSLRSPRTYRDPDDEAQRRIVAVVQRRMLIGGARRLRTATRATMQLRSHAKWEAEALAVPAAPSRPLSARRSARNGEIKAEVKAEEIKVEAVAATVRATGLRVKREPSPKTPDLSVVVKREAKTPSPRKKKAKTRVPRAEPPKWREQLKGIQEMRAKKDAEVDTHGCDVFFDPSKYPAHVARYHVLIAAMMSSQTKDPVNAAAMERLIEHGLTVQDMLDIDETELAQLIRPVGFFNNKAKYIKQVAAILKERAGDSDVIDIPDTYEELIALPGVGPKMAFLVMDCAWNNTVGICVDTHVHRISNRLKWVKTWNKVNPKSQDPEKTRAELEDWLPREHWGPINPLLVGFGQTICQPRNPKCDKCKIKDICPSANKGTI